MTNPLNALRLGQLAQLADACSDAQHNVEVFERLAKKKDKSAKTRADAASNALYWRTQQAKACASPTPAMPVPGAPQEVQQLPSTPLPSAPVSVSPTQTGGPYPAYSVAPQSYDQSNIQASPYISPSISADIVAALTGQNPIPVGSGASVPSVSVAQQAGVLAECSSEYGAALPLEYEDQYGPMKVIQIRCV